MKAVGNPALRSRCAGPDFGPVVMEPTDGSFFETSAEAEVVSNCLGACKWESDPVASDAVCSYSLCTTLG